jgi:hypothetical protein
LRVAGFTAFLHRVPHVPGRNELSFLDVDRAAAQRSRHHEVGLAAQKRWNLQNIDCFRDTGDVRYFVNISEHRNLDFIFDLFQDAQAFLDARPAKAADRRAVGFVVTGFEDKRETECPGHALDDLCHTNGVLFALNHTGAGDEEEIPRANADVADLEGRNQKQSLSPPSTQRAPRQTISAKDRSENQA